MTIKNKSCGFHSAKLLLTSISFPWASFEKWLRYLAENKLPEMCVFFKTLIKCVDFMYFYNYIF